MRLKLGRLSRGLPAAVVAMAVMLLVAAGFVAWYDETAYRTQKAREIEVQARILASTVSAALMFDDQAAAAEYARAMGVNTEIRAVAVFDAKGGLFASYVRDPADVLPAQAPPEGVEYSGDDVLVTAPAENSSGSVHVRAAAQSWTARLSRYVGLAFLSVMALLMVAVMAGAQSALNRVNRRLQTQIEEREKVEEALRQAQKMETIGRLTGGVAHDFNNLLTVIIGNVERVLRRLDAGADPAELRRAASNALLGSQRAAGLTKSLLAFARRQPLSPKPIDVNVLIRNMADLVRRTLGEQIALESVIAAGLWRAQADPNQLESAILNLAVNARDAMPRGGKLTIEVANAYLDSRYAAEAEVKPGQYIAISVSDTGTGMTKEVMDRAFEPFFTTKEVGHGTGLGLSQVYGFVKQSGGHVRMYSEVGAGTTVRIYLPRLHGEDAVASESSRAMPPASTDVTTILVVEDEAGVRDHSVTILRELGYRVLEAPTGAAALEMLARDPGVRLLFTDVGLPGGMNGRQLADRVVRLYPRIKVLFTTGYARNAIVHDGRLDPGVHLVTKPYSFAELAQALQVVLADHPRGGDQASDQR